MGVGNKIHWTVEQDADNALELAASVIKKFEGLRLESYKDSAGIATIGYGATRIDGKPVKMGMKIDRDKAEALLRADLLRFYRAVLSLVTVPLTDGMLVALTSFAFNVGVGALKSSTLLRRLNAGDYVGASNEFEKWCKVKGKPINGLIRRRKEEKALFLRHLQREDIDILPGLKAEVSRSKT